MSATAEQACCAATAADAARGRLAKRLLMLAVIGAACWLLGLIFGSHAAHAATPDPSTTQRDSRTIASSHDVIRNLVDRTSDPVTKAVAPVVSKVVTPVVAPVTKAVTPVVSKVVSKVVTPVVAPVVKAVTPVVAPVVKPVVAPIVKVVEPVVRPVAQLTAITSHPAPQHRPVAAAGHPAAVPAGPLGPTTAPAAAGSHVPSSYPARHLAPAASAPIARPTALRPAPQSPSMPIGGTDPLGLLGGAGGAASSGSSAGAGGAADLIAAGVPTAAAFISTTVRHGADSAAAGLPQRPANSPD